MSDMLWLMLEPYHYSQRWHMNGLPYWLWSCKQVNFIWHGPLWKGCAIAGCQTWLEMKSCSKTGWAACHHGCSESSRSLHGELWYWWCLDRSWCLWCCYDKANPKMYTLQAFSLCPHLFVCSTLWNGTRWVLQKQPTAGRYLLGGNRE